MQGIQTKRQSPGCKGLAVSGLFNGEEMSNGIETGKWCWSDNGENYHGSYDTEEEAHCDALTGYLPGEEVHYWIGKTLSPLDGINSDILGDRIAEQIEEWMLDDCFACEFDEILSLTKQDTNELGSLVLSFIREKGVIQYYTVTDAKEQTHVVQGEG